MYIIMRKILNITSYLLLFLIFSFGFVREAKAVQIRQEININDQSHQASGTAANGQVQLDTTQYNGTVTYYFETVARNSGSNGTVTLKRSSGTTDATVTVSSSTNTRYRVEFTPPSGQTVYHTEDGGTINSLHAGDRIIVIQNAATLTTSETQIEIGNKETGKTNTTAAPLTSPKYWLYTAANWNGTKTFYAEVTYYTSTTQTVTATLQEDDGSFGATWTDVVTIVNAASTNGTIVRTRSAGFTPTTGRNYRISARESSSAGGRNYRIYNAKIIIDQSNNPTRLETQYLLLNTNSTATGLQSFNTYFDPAEWSGVTNTYKHAQDAIGATANSRLKDIDNANAILTHSSITGANQQIGSAITDMPTAAHHIDTDIVAVGTEIDASRILVAVFANLPPAVDLNTADSTVFDTGTPTVEFTGTDADTNDIEYNVQIDTVNTFDSVVGNKVTDSYSEANQDLAASLNDTQTGVGQSFTGDDGVLDSAKFYLMKQVTPTGSAVAKIYNHGALWGQNGYPTGAALATSDNFDVSTVSSVSYELKTLTFSGANRITLTNGTHYFVTIEYTGTATDLLKVGMDGSSPTHPGNGAAYQGGWFTAASYDFIFYVYTEANVPLLDKNSVDHAGFVNPDVSDPHPFFSGDNIQYTVQAGDTLTPGDYFWRVAGKDPAPSGTNIYGAWSPTRSFTVSVGPTKVVFTNSGRTLIAGACNGDADVLTIQLQDAGSTPTNPTGTTVINVTSNSPSETVYSDNGCTSATNDFTFTTAQNTKSVYIKDTRKSSPTWTLTATKSSGPDTIADGTQSITINAGSVTRLVVTLPSQTFSDGVGNSGSVINQTAGSSFVITKISATDNYFNVNTGYSGAKTIGYAGPGNAPNSTPPSYTTAVSFTSGQSTTTLTTILYKAESPTITATDGGLYGYASSSLTVDPGILNNYQVVAATPQTAAVCFTGTNTVTARDAWNNTRTTDGTVVNMTHNGTSVTFYTSAGCSGITTQYTLVSGQVTMYIKTPKKQSGITITATRDGFAETGTSGSITVDPAAASAILVKLPGQTFTDGTGISGSPSFTGLRTPNATAGVSYTVDFKAVDANNNLVDSGPNNYTGSKTISFADSVAGDAPNSQTPSFPASPVTFTNGAADTLSVTYYNAAASRTVEADDTGTPVSGVVSTTFTVQAGSINNYGVSASTPQIAGVAFNVTVTARDSWNNSLGSLYSAPAGTYVWTTTAGLAPDTTAPVIGTLIAGNFTNGVATKSVTAYKAESGVTFTASEPSPSTVTGTSGGVTENPGSISADVNDSTVTGDASVSTDTNSTITITLKDTWRNPKSSVPAANVVLGATATEIITQPSSATDANGVTTGQVKWSNVGEKTVTVTIQTSTLVQNDGTTPDADGKLDDTHTITVVVSANAVKIKGGMKLRSGSLLGQ